MMQDHTRQPVQGASMSSAFSSNRRLNRKSAQRRSPVRRRAFLLILVVVVLAMASLAALNFSESMLVSHEVARHSGGRLQARMCAESGAQSIRLFLAYPRLDRLEQGGTWSNPNMFQALNVIPDSDPARRGNFSVISPSLDEFGNYNGIRFGLQNESAKLNLLTLAQLDALASSGDMASSAASAVGGGGGGDGGGEAGAAAAITSALASEATSAATSTLATDILMALPGMTEYHADAILDFLDEDEDPRPYGAEFSDYYSQLEPAYKPANGPINSIEQLLLVRDVTPALLFGYDENRNGMLDQAEMNKMNSGIQPGLAPGALPTTATDPDATPPPPLGWASYLTIHSQEKNISTDGYERININSDDLELLYEDLVAVLGNETWASFIVAYRMGGSPGGDGQSPMVKLAQMALTESESQDGVLGSQLDALSAAGPGGGGQETEPWTPDMLSQFDLTQGGSVQFNQVLDLIDATVSVGGQGGGGQGGGGGDTTFSSPFTSLPLDLANSTPVLMNYLTTVDGPALPGRINIMECPQEILFGIPGIPDEIVEEILEARVDGSESETRQFETWLAVEGYLTIDEMRAIMPLVTCGGDVYKAQIIGYLEGNAAFSRVEAVISGAGELPEILFFRRMDHHGRGFDITTLGQRFDAGVLGTQITR